MSLFILMPFDETKAKTKIDKLDKKINKLEIKLHELNTIRNSLASICDIETYEKGEDGNKAMDIDGNPIILKTKPFDNLTGEILSDSRRNEIFDILDAKSDAELADQS